MRGVWLYRMWDLVMVWSSLQPKVPNCAQREGLWPWSVVRPRTGLSWSSQHLQLAGITPDQSGRDWVRTVVRPRAVEN